jgi:hypothetical protein
VKYLANYKTIHFTLDMKMYDYSIVTQRLFSESIEDLKTVLHGFTPSKYDLSKMCFCSAWKMKGFTSDDYAVHL